MIVFTKRNTKMILIRGYDFVRDFSMNVVLHINQAFGIYHTNTFFNETLYEVSIH